MSRDGYEGWDDQADVQEPGSREARGGRRSRRSGRPDEQWLGRFAGRRGSA